jgi:hypothetical protein
MHYKATKCTLRLMLGLLLFLSPAFCRSWRVGDDCPSAIQVVIPGRTWDESEEPMLDTMASVHAALSNCPNITSLDLRVSLQGCSGWPDRWSFPFSLYGGETYPALHRLRLEGYRFGDRPIDEVSWAKEGYYDSWYERTANWILSGNVFRALKYRRIPKEQREKNNIELWLDAMDWSNVEELVLLGYSAHDRHPFLNSTPSVLTELRRLELESECGGDTLQFLQNLQNNSLTHLTWRNYFGPDLPAILQESQGLSLQHLDIHTVETTHVESPAYSAAELEPLQYMPNLTHVALSIPRNGTWPWEMLSAISRIPSLRTAEFWLDIASTCRKQKDDSFYPGEQGTECIGEDQYLLPFVNKTSTLEVFKYLRANKSGMELSNVTFRGGDWSRAWDGPLYSPPWLEHRSVKVVCSLQDNQGLEGEECTVLNGANYWKQRGRSYWDDDDFY